MQDRQKVLVTGGEGFVGSHLVEVLHNASIKVVHASRRRRTGDSREIRFYDLASNDDIDLTDIDCIVHLAAVAHSDNVDAGEINRINSLGTQNLAKQALAQGVNKFIFLSSIGVYGNVSSTPLNEASPLKPHNAYTQSKLEAEQHLAAIANQSELQTFILRAPLIYGANAKGSFAALQKWVQLGLPLPFACIQNQRSVCSVNTLSDCILRIIQAKASGLSFGRLEYFNVADNQGVSSPQICRALANAIDKPLRLIKLPISVLSFLFKASNKASLKASLLDDLMVDNTYLKDSLNWHDYLENRSLESELMSMLSPHADNKAELK